MNIYDTTFVWLDSLLKRAMTGLGLSLAQGASENALSSAANSCARRRMIKSGFPINTAESCCGFLHCATVIVDGAKVAYCY